MTNLRGLFQDKLGTFRTTIALTHLNLIRVWLRRNVDFRLYAEPIYRLYVQSLNPEIEVVSYVEAMKILDSDLRSITLELPDLEGYVGLSDWERVFVASIVPRFRNRPAFEIGTGAGSTATLISMNTDETVYTLDLPSDTENSFALTRLSTDDEVIANRKRGSFLRDNARPNVVELIGDSALFDFEPYVGKIGIFFIDGAHSLEYVSSDTRNASLCCADDGLIVWDDFGGSRDVSRFLRSLVRRGAIIRAVEGTKLAFSRDVVGIRQLLSDSDPR
jgi:hypothetical protein